MKLTININPANVKHVEDVAARLGLNRSECIRFLLNTGLTTVCPGLLLTAEEVLVLAEETKKERARAAKFKVQDLSGA